MFKPSQLTMMHNKQAYCHPLSKIIQFSKNICLHKTAVYRIVLFVTTQYTAVIRKSNYIDNDYTKNMCIGNTHLMSEKHLVENVFFRYCCVTRSSFTLHSHSCISKNNTKIFTYSDRKLNFAFLLSCR